MDLSQASNDGYVRHDHTRWLSSTWMQLCFKELLHEGYDKFRNAQRQIEMSNSRGEKKVEETTVLLLYVSSISLLSSKLSMLPPALPETDRHILTNLSGFWPQLLLANMVQNPWEASTAWPICYGLTRPNAVIAVLHRKWGHRLPKQADQIPPFLKVEAKVGFFFFFLKMHFLRFLLWCH